MNQLVKGHIIFDHDGTLMQVDQNGINLFPGMFELIENLKKENYAIYIWTARGRNSTINSLRQQNLLTFISDIYCGDDGMMKPHPMGPLKLTEGIEKKQIVHIGDSMGDLEGAQNFGIEFIYAAWNEPALGKKYEELTPYVAYNLIDCKKFIDLKFN